MTTIFLSVHTLFIYVYFFENFQSVFLSQQRNRFNFPHINCLKAGGLSIEMSGCGTDVTF